MTEYQRPFTHFSEDQRAYRRQIEDNAGKVANAFGFFQSTGQGQVICEDVIDFGCIFLERPGVSHGYALSETSPELIVGAFPKAWGGVTEWVRDKDGFYQGAYVFLCVETFSFFPAESSDPGYELDHTFTFTGMALKRLSTELFEE